MIINISRHELLVNIANIQNVTSKKTSIAILSNFLIEALNDYVLITATDLEVCVKIKINADVVKSGSITIPSRKFFEMVREINDEFLHIEVLENKWITISTNYGNYKLSGIDSDEYPSIPNFDSNLISSISSHIISEAIDKTLFSIAQENDNQFNLMGVLFEKETRNDKNYVRFVSSDGHRLSFFEKELDTNVDNLVIGKNTLIPKKGLLEVKKLCDFTDFIEVGFEENQAIFKSDNVCIFIRLLNGEFPNYRNMLKSINKSYSIEIDRNIFISSMKRINIFTEDLYNSVNFDFSTDLLVLSSQNVDIGSAKEEIKINYTGDNMVLGFNGKYFIDPLQVMISDKINAYINNERSPCLIEGNDDPGFMSIIMPMKI